MKTIVSEKGQITIPKTLRIRLGLRAGQVLELAEERGRLVATKGGSGDAVEEAFGILDLPGSTDKMMAALRGKPGAR